MLIKDDVMRQAISDTIAENWPRSAVVNPMDIAQEMVKRELISGNTKKVIINGLVYWTENETICGEYTALEEQCEKQ